MQRAQPLPLRPRHVSGDDTAWSALILASKRVLPQEPPAPATSLAGALGVGRGALLHGHRLHLNVIPNLCVSVSTFLLSRCALRLSASILRCVSCCPFCQRVARLCRHFESPYQYINASLSALCYSLSALFSMAAH